MTGHPSFGLPWGQDRLIPIFLATLAIRQQSQTIQFRSAAEMLDSFGMQQGGTQYRRLVAAFQRIFGATIFFGTDTQRERAAVVHQARFNFMRRGADLVIHATRIKPHSSWRLPKMKSSSADAGFFKEIMSHPIPTDMEAAKALSCSPAALDLFMWLSYRCFVAKGRERVPLFGDFGLVNQLGSSDYARPRKFRERLEGWLDLAVRSMWPECILRRNGYDWHRKLRWVDRAAAVLPAWEANDAYIGTTNWNLATVHGANQEATGRGSSSEMDAFLGTRLPRV